MKVELNNKSSPKYYLYFEVSNKEAIWNYWILPGGGEKRELSF